VIFEYELPALESALVVDPIESFSPGARLLVSGDPDRKPAPGVVLGVAGRKLTIALDRDDEGAADVIYWLTTRGDVGIMLVEGETEPA